MLNVKMTQTGSSIVQCQKLKESDRCFNSMCSLGINGEGIQLEKWPLTMECACVCVCCPRELQVAHKWSVSVFRQIIEGVMTSFLFTNPHFLILFISSLIFLNTQTDVREKTNSDALDVPT